MIRKIWETSKNPDKKNCLIILPRAIFPIVSGYSNKNYNLIKSLSHHYNLHIILLSFEDLSDEEKKFYCKYTTILIQARLSKTISYLNSFFYLFTKEPIQVGYYYRPHIAKYIKHNFKHIEIVIGSLIRSEKYLRIVNCNSIRIFDMVDSIGLTYYKSFTKTKNIFWKLIYKIDGQRLLRLERESVSRYDITFFVNQNEQQQYKSCGNTAWLPHGVKHELFYYNKDNVAYHNSVAFIGKMDYRPNIDAVKWYVENVHSKIGDKIPLIITGACPTKEILDLTTKYTNITVTGYCEDPYIYLKSVLAIIAPMQTGGGIQNKVLEGMALGKVNIITSLAAAPIKGGKNNEHFIVANTAEEYISLITKISQSPENYKNIGSEAQKLIFEKFTWDSYCKLFIKSLKICENKKL